MMALGLASVSGQHHWRWVQLLPDDTPIPMVPAGRSLFLARIHEILLLVVEIVTMIIVSREALPVRCWTGPKVRTVVLGTRAQSVPFRYHHCLP
jgi:hypothetical protein